MITAAKLTIEGLRAMAVDVEMERPVQTGSGEIRSTPLVLIDLQTRKGVVGRSYVWSYTPLPGHMVGQVAVIVRGEDVTYLVAGDVSYKKQNLIEEEVDGVTMDVQTSLAGKRWTWHPLRPTDRSPEVAGMENRKGDRPEIRGRGGCLCGAVRYEVRGPLRQVVACHCTQCRRTSGHFAAFTAARPEDLVLIESGGLRWYRSSAMARRGFCGVCGSNILWEPASGGRISIAAGTLDSPTGLAMAVHVFVGDAGDYYTIGDGLPRRADGDHGVAIPDD